MDIAEREKKLGELANMLSGFLDDPKYSSDIIVSYFIPHCFSEEERGIWCTYYGSDKSVIEDLLGFVDIPAMIYGFQIGTAISKIGNAFHLFVYDDEKYHPDNIKRLGMLRSKTIIDRK